MGWFTYLIRKKRPLGARFAAYRLTLRLPGLIRAACASPLARVRHIIRHAVNTLWGASAK